MQSLLLLSVLLGLEAPVQRVVDALSEPSCPRLYAMLSERFQRHVPRSAIVAVCGQVGRIDTISRTEDDAGQPAYRARSASGEWKLRLALTDGRVSLLQVLPRPRVETAKTLADKLAEVGARYHLPGISARMIEDGHVTQQASWGVRKLGDKTPIGADDRWHLGSDTKAMTATLAALLVQEGKLAWDKPIGAVLADWKDLDPRYAKGTLAQLLSHRAGLPHDVTPALGAAMATNPDAVAGRRDAVHAMLKLAPAKVGEYAYSNVGYMAAGVILERVTGQPWETLMRMRLFAPLGMRSCGFGGPATPGTIDAPWAHRGSGDVVVPVEPGPSSDNPPALGPAGTVHCSLADWQKLVAEHVRGERGERTTLALGSGSFRKLHAPVGDGGYALGWMVAQVPGSAGPVLSHEGSNNLFYASVFAAPTEHRIVLVATNRGGPPAASATREVVDFLTSARTQP